MMQPKREDVPYLLAIILRGAFLGLVIGGLTILLIGYAYGYF